MQAVPILTRHTLELLREHIAQATFDQLMGLSESTIQFFKQYTANERMIMENNFSEFSHQYTPYRYALIQILVLLLGESDFDKNYLSLMRKIEDEIMQRASRKALPLNKIQHIYQQYETFFTRVTSQHKQQQITTETAPNLHIYLENLWRTSTEFDFSFTAFNLVLFDEIPCNSKDKYIFLIEKSTERLEELTTDYSLFIEALTASTDSPQTDSPNNLLHLAGSLPSKDAQEILAAIEKNCEHVDAGW